MLPLLDKYTISYYTSSHETRIRFYQLAVRSPEKPEPVSREDRSRGWPRESLLFTRRQYLEVAGVAFVLSLFAGRGRSSAPRISEGSRFLSCWSARAGTS
jgi:hypothetical protein